jgi:hypothetical protein
LGIVEGLFEILTSIIKQRERGGARPGFCLNPIVLSVSHFTFLLMAAGFVISVVGMILSFHNGDDAARPIELSHFDPPLGQ